MSSTNSGPCAACKLLRRKCTQECVFAPHFPPDQHQKFANIHKVFGASNVAKLLNELKIDQREDAVISLAYEAEARLLDPIYGCIGVISIMQHRLKRVHQDLYIAKNELANYIGPSAMFPMLQPPGFIQPHANNPTSPAIFPYNMQAPMLGLPAGQPTGAAHLVIQDQHHRQMLEAQQLARVGVAATREHQEMFRSYEQQSDQLLRYAAAMKQQEMFRAYEQQQAQQSDQLVRLTAAREHQEMYRSYEQQQAQQSDQHVRLAAGRELQELFRSYEQQQEAQQSDQLVRLTVAREHQEMFRSYEQQQAQQSDQHVRLAAAREHQEMFRSYEQQQAQQSDQHVRLAAAREHQEMFRSFEHQAQQSDQLVRLAATTEQQEMFMGYEQQPQQSDQLVRLNAGFDTAGQVTASGFNQMALGGLTISPSLALGSYDNPYQNQQLPQDHAHQIQPQDHSHHHHQIQQQDHFYHHHQIQLQLLLEQQHLAQQQQQQNQPPGQPQVAPQQQQNQPLGQPQLAPQQQHRAGSEEGRGVGPSC